MEEYWPMQQSCDRRPLPPPPPRQPPPLSEVSDYEYLTPSDVSDRTFDSYTTTEGELYLTGGSNMAYNQASTFTPVNTYANDAISKLQKHFEGVGNSSQGRIGEIPGRVGGNKSQPEPAPTLPSRRVGGPAGQAGPVRAGMRGMGGADQPPRPAGRREYIPEVPVSRGTVYQNDRPGLPALTCSLCDQYTAAHYCRSCRRLLCDTCRRGHVKMAACREEDSEDAHALLAKHAGNLDRKLDRFEGFKREISQRMARRDEEIRAEENALIRKLEDEERLELQRVRERYEGERKAVVDASDRRRKEIRRRGQELVSRVNQEMEGVRLYKEGEARALLESGEQVVAQISSKLGQLEKSIGEVMDRPSDQPNRKPVAPVQPEVRQSNGSGGSAVPSRPPRGEGHQPSAKFKVVVLPKGLSQGDGQEGLGESQGRKGADQSQNSAELRSLPSRDLQEATSVELKSWPYKLLEMAGGDIWCLLGDSILVLDRHGQTRRTISNKFSEASNMARTRHDAVVVCSSTQGLLGVDASGGCRAISRGVYHNVCADASRLIGLTEQDGCVVLVIFQNSGGGWQHRTTVTTSVKRDAWNLTCALIRDHLYICPSGENVVYTLDPDSGRVSNRITCEGADKLYACTWDSEHLLMADHGGATLRLMELLPSGCHWHAVNITVRQPRAAALTSKGDLMVAGSHGRAQYYLSVFR